MPHRVGLIVGREWSWPPAFIEEVNRRDEGVVADYVKIGGSRMNQRVDYAVIIDRISHEIPAYRSYLKNAVLQGVTVVNNPFMWSADDKFFGASLATRLGVVSPKTVLLPNKSYVEGVVEESLRNLEYPLDWEGIADYVGLPAILKDAHGGGGKDVHRVDSVSELIERYDESGQLTMILQEMMEWEHYIRCLCVDYDNILPMKYDPIQKKYFVEHEHMDPELGQRVVDDCIKVNRALDYRMNTIEFAIYEDVPYAIDFMNPAPDMDIHSLTPFYFDWAVNAMADMAIRLAKNPPQEQREFRWQSLFGPE